MSLPGATKAYDKSLDIYKYIEQSPVWYRYTDTESLISSAYELTNSFVDVGSEIDMRGYNQLVVWPTVDIGTSTNIEMRILFKHTSGGAEEYRQVNLDVGAPAITLTNINLNDYRIANNVDQLIAIPINVGNAIPFVQLQFKDSADGDGQIDTLYVTKAWSPTL